MKKHHVKEIFIGKNQTPIAVLSCKHRKWLYSFKKMNVKVGDLLHCRICHPRCYVCGDED